MGTSLRPDDDPLEVLKALRATRSPVAEADPLDELKALRGSGRQLPRGYRTPDQIARLNRQDVSAASEPDVPTSLGGTLAQTGRELLGSATATGKYIPGARALQASARSLRPNTTYQQALAEIEGNEEDTPALARGLAGGAGGVLAASAMPGLAAKVVPQIARVAPKAAQAIKSAMSTGAKQGAVFGGAEGALSADPETASARLWKTVTGAGVGMLGGKLGEQIATATKAFAPAILGGTRTLGRQSLDRNAAMKLLESPLWAQVEQEAQTVATSPAIRRVLSDPAVKPFVKAARKLVINKGKTDSEIVLEVMKDMSEAQGRAGTILETTRKRFASRAASQKRELGAAKERVRVAVEDPTAPVLPSLRPAQQAHAANEDIKAAAKRATRMGRDIIKGKLVDPDKIDLDSQEAYLNEVVLMPKEKARAALDAVLGTLKETPRLSSDPLKGFFGIGTSAMRIPLALSRLQPLIHALDARAGTGAGRRALEKLGMTVGAMSTSTLSNDP